MTTTNRTTVTATTVTATTVTATTATAPRALPLLRAGAAALVAVLGLAGGALAAGLAAAADTSLAAAADTSLAAVSLTTTAAVSPTTAASASPTTAASANPTTPAAANLAAAASASPTTPAAADAPWTVRAAPGELGGGRSELEYAVNPGDRVDDGIVVTNTGDEPLTLDVYAADAVTSDEGAFDLATRDDAASGIGRWLLVEPTQVDVAPGESATVPLVLVVPDDAAPGDLWGGVVASRTQDDADGTPTERRVGMRVHVRVSGAVTPTLAVEDVRLGYDGGFRGSGAGTVTFTVRNTGTVAVAGRPTAVVAGPFGTFRSESAGADDTPTLLPGESWPVTVEISSVTASGLLTATASVAPVYTDPAGSTAELAAVSGVARAWAVPWVPLIAVIVVLGFVGLLFAPKRRRGAGAEAAAEAAAEEPAPAPAG